MSKRIGTPVETAVVRYLQGHGWPHAERRALNGALDKGDITGIPGLCIEVKGGKAAEVAGDGQVAKWLEETEEERVNANAEIGLLVMKRRGVGAARAGEFWAVIDGGVFADLVYEPAEGEPRTNPLGFPVRLHLANLVEVLRDAGWGDPR